MGEWREFFMEDLGLDPHTREGRARLSIWATLALFGGVGGFYAAFGL